MATATVMAIIAGVTAVASIGEGIYAAVDKPKAPTVPNLAAEQAKEAQAAALAQANALQKRRGMASTMMTSPMGMAPAPTQKATLGN